MAHENSITIQTPRGKWVNIPSVVGGKQLSERAATKAFNEGRIKPLGGVQFDSVDSAVKAAKQRSEKFNGRP